MALVVKNVAISKMIPSFCTALKRWNPAHRFSRMAAYCVISRANIISIGTTKVGREKSARLAPSEISSKGLTIRHVAVRWVTKKDVKGYPLGHIRATVCAKIAIKSSQH